MYTVKCICFCIKIVFKCSFIGSSKGRYRQVHLILEIYRNFFNRVSSRIYYFPLSDFFQNLIRNRRGGLIYGKKFWGQNIYGLCRSLGKSVFPLLKCCTIVSIRVMVHDIQPWPKVWTHQFKKFHAKCINFFLQIKS